MLCRADYTDEQWNEMQKGIEEKLARKWTNSPHVENIFEILGKNAPEVSAADAKSDYPNNGEHWDRRPEPSDVESGFGFVSPKASKNAAPYGTKAYAGDARYCNVDGFSVEYFPAISKFRCKGANVAKMWSDYAETVLIIDDPALLDLLAKVGAYKLPSTPRGSKQVFLALHPAFVEAHPEIQGELDAARTEGNLFDIRDYAGLIEREGEWTIKTKWLGEAPLELMEPLLSARLAEAASSVRGRAMRGYTDTKYGKIKNLQDATALANTLMLDKSFVTVPSLSSGKRGSAKGIWAKICEGHNFDFSCAKPSADAMELSHKVDMVESAARLWNDMYDKTRLCVCIDERELGRHGFIYERFEELAKITGMDSTIEALKEGVPEEDLLS